MAKEENEKEKNKPKPCPKWLNNTAKKEWRRVAKILAEEGKDFTDKDLAMLMGLLLCIEENGIEHYNPVEYLDAM